MTQRLVICPLDFSGTRSMWFSDYAGLSLCRADHPERLDRDWSIGIDVVRAVEIDRMDAEVRYKLLQVDYL
jgi:hypothetical protein